MDSALTLTYVPGPPIAASDALWLNMEQEKISEWAQSASLADITAMWHMAMTGLSATNYIADRCPVTITDGIITVFLGLYVFPSPGMAYKLSISSGAEFDDMEEREVVRDFDIIVPQSDSVTLDFIPEDNIAFVWQTEAYNAFGERIERPEITVDKNILSFSESCFAVLRCTCTTLAQYYPVYLFIEKAKVVVDTESEAERKQKCRDRCEALYGSGSLDPNFNLYLPCITACDQAIKTNKPPERTGFKISNLRATVQATWMGTDKKIADKSLTLKIPKCVDHLLELCDNGSTKNTGLAMNDDEYTTIVYYSTCTGNILDVVTERANPDHPVHRRTAR